MFDLRGIWNRTYERYFMRRTAQEEIERRLENLRRFNPKRMAQAILDDLTSYAHSFSEYVSREGLNFPEAYLEFVSNRGERPDLGEIFVGLSYRFPQPPGFGNDWPDSGIYASFGITRILEKLGLEPEPNWYSSHSARTALELMRLLGDKWESVPRPENPNTGIRKIYDMPDGYFVIDQGTNFKFGQGNVDNWSIGLRLMRNPAKHSNTKA
jgi:hypothetical protein